MSLGAPRFLELLWNGTKHSPAAFSPKVSPH
jgi:hypothetical protein